jgi:hypothetical protein
MRSYTMNPLKDTNFVQQRERKSSGSTDGAFKVKKWVCIAERERCDWSQTQSLCKWGVLSHVRFETEDGKITRCTGRTR